MGIRRALDRPYIRSGLVDRNEQIERAEHHCDITSPGTEERPQAVLLALWKWEDPDGFSHQDREFRRNDRSDSDQ